MPAPTDSAITKAEHDQYHSPAYAAAGAAMMSFTPINQIHQQLCALHTYAKDPSRAVRAHHFCTHLRKNLHQCIIYDSEKADARLIGIEYIIPEKEFTELPEEEKKYWHSHKYEVESGMLMMVTKPGVPNVAADIAERPAMLELHRTYGKTIHTWAFDEYPDLPLGPPHLMMSYTADDQVNKEELDKRDSDLGVSTEAKRQVRREYLREEDLARPPAEGCDVPDQGRRLRFALEDNTTR